MEHRNNGETDNTKYTKYKVFGGYLTYEYTTDDFNKAIDEFLKRVEFTKAFTNAAIFMLSTTYENGKVVEQKIEHMVCMPSKETFHLMCLDNSPDYYAMKYE